MSYIWNDYSDEKKYVLGIKNIVSGIEVWNDKKEETSVNVLVRLFDLVFPKKYIDSEDKNNDLAERYTSDSAYQEIFNLMMHFQALLDRNSGCTVNDILALTIQTSILNSEFGEDIRNYYLSINDKARYYILNYYAEYLISQSREKVFEKFIENYYVKVNLYFQQSTYKTYIYIHEDKTEENLIILKLAEYFLCEIDRDIEIMWKGEHIPIIGFDYSMIIENMCLG